MFDKLVESNSRTGEFARKGYIFIATLVAYVLLLGLGILVAIAYAAPKLQEQSIELVALLSPAIEESNKAISVTKAETKPSSTGGQNMPKATTRTGAPAVSSDPTKTVDKARVESRSGQWLPPEGLSRSSTGDGLGPEYSPGRGLGPTVGSGGGGSSGRKPLEELPEPPKIAVPKQSQMVYIGAIRAETRNLPLPGYPLPAKLARVQGPVAVEILIDEKGNVISARVKSGHPLLRAAAAKAAYKANFSPALINGTPAKATGTITYNFVLR